MAAIADAQATAAVTGSTGRTSYRATGVHPNQAAGVVPLTKAQRRRALAEHDRLVRRARLQAAKASPPAGRACTGSGGGGGRHCAARFKRALADFGGARLSSVAEVVLPQEKGPYNTDRRQTRLANEMYDNKPAAIVYLGAEADAAVVTDMAQTAGCRVCGRSGGHDTAGASVCPGGVVADVSRLAGVQVDAGLGVARIQAGAKWGAIDDLLGAQGLGALAGICPTVSVAGYTLGGGWGALSKMFGVGSDNVLSYTVAIPGTQQGGSAARLVVANATGPYSDLFFALRGAGHSSFGLMTSMTYRVFPMPTVAVAQVWFPNLAANRALGAQALHLWQQQLLNQPPLELAVFPLLGDNPATGTFDLVFAAMYGSSAPGAQAALVAALQPLVNLGGQLAWAQTLSYAQARNYTDNIRPPPLREGSADPTVYWEYKMGQYVTRPLTAAEFLALVDGVLSLPALATTTTAKKGGPAAAALYRFAYLEGYEGAMTAPAPTATAFAHRSVGFDMAVDVFAPPAVPGALAAATDWLRALYGQRWAGIVGPSAYQNYPSVFYQPRRVALEKYYGENLCRLVGIKAKYDPRQVFGWLEEDKAGSNESGNQGVPPSLPGC